MGQAGTAAQVAKYDKSDRATSPLTLLRQMGAATSVVEYGRKDVIFTQGSRAESVLLVQSGIVKVTMVSGQGKEAIVDVLSRGSFLGEDCLAGRDTRAYSAEALVKTSAISMPKHRMLTAIRKSPDLAEALVDHLARSRLRTEEDLAYQLLSSSEARLARALIRIAQAAETDPGSGAILPPVSQETLARMVGTTRSRISFFLNKFRRQGLIEYDKGLRITRALLAIVRD
jgi:CRP-like cAMP-binding protein